MEFGDRALFVKSDDIRKARGKQSGKYNIMINGSPRRPPAAVRCLIINCLSGKYCYRDTHESITNSAEHDGPDGRSHSDVAAIEISKPTEPEPTFG